MLSGGQSRWSWRCGWSIAKISEQAWDMWQKLSCRCTVQNFYYNNEWELVHEGGQYLGPNWFHYSVIKEKTNKLGFDLFLVDINGLLDREKIYGYDDDTERFTAFQIAVCDWLSKWQHWPDVIHVHDHHAGLDSFYDQICYAFRHLKLIYQQFLLFIMHNTRVGWVGIRVIIPAYDSWKWGMLDWKNNINPLASAVKCAWKVNTVSHSYMDELRYTANGLEDLFEYEKGKCTGILNGIDNEVWDPETDELSGKKLFDRKLEKGKQKIKKRSVSNLVLMWKNLCSLL